MILVPILQSEGCVVMIVQFGSYLYLTVELTLLEPVDKGCVKPSK